MSNHDEPTHKGTELGRTGVEAKAFWLLQPARLTLNAQPFEGCDVCAALVKQREAARHRTGSLTEWECDRELRAHPHRRAGDFK
jgi:hypothetical protein